MKEWRVGHNKPSNKAAQTVRKNCQNLFNTGELVVQGYSEEITSKVQKYARMSATQFVSYSYGELTIENIKEACVRLSHVNFNLAERCL